MAVSSLWYPDTMLLSRSRTSPPNFRRIPSSVESCLQWEDTPAERPVVRTTTRSPDRYDVHTCNQRRQRQVEESPTRYNINTGYDGRRSPYDSRHQATRFAGVQGSFRSRSPCRHPVNSNVANTRPYSQFANPSTMEQTTWSTMNGSHMEEDDVIEAVHRVADDTWSSTETVGERFADKRRYHGSPSRLPRSALKRTPSGGRRVQVLEDERGRTRDLTVMPPAVPQTSRGRPRVDFALQTTPHPSSRPASARHQTLQVRGDVNGSTRYDHVTTGGDELAAGYDDEGARQALLAIYQAGKPDMRFHTRAPSSAALEKMLLAMSDAKVRDSPSVAGGLRRCESIPRTYPQHRDAEAGHRYAAGRDVSDDEKPVKVKVECPPYSDTVVSFRVQSKAA